MQLLLVDDNEISLELQKQLIESCGYTVVAVNSGEKAIELAENTDFFAILMDVCMPKMDGFTASSIIRKFNPDVKIYALSADKIESDNPDFIRSGMNGAFLKPLNEESLMKITDKSDIQNCNNQESSNSVFGYDELLALVGGESSVLLILNSFIESHSNDLDMLQRYISDNDFLAARGVMHSLTGVAGSLYCRDLYDASVALSADLRRESYDSFENFTKIWYNTISQLNKCRERLCKNTRGE